MTPQPTSRPQPGVDAVFRVLASGIFLVAGTKHLLATGHIVERLRSVPLADLVTAVAPAPVLVVAAGLVLAFGGAALLLGLRTSTAALALMAVVLPITLTVQTAPGQSGPLFKNIAILGALLHFLFAGGGPWSLDGWRARRRHAAERKSP